MNKYLLLLLIPIFTLFSGCSTVQSSGKSAKLNRSELAGLEIAAKNTILNMPDSSVSKAEKQYVRKNSPALRVFYTGYKQGKYSLTWEIDTGKVIQVFGKGNMLDFRNSFTRVSIASLKVVEN